VRSVELPSPQPDATYFDVMAAHARTHWWYEGRRRLVSAVLGRTLPPPSRVLDIGCGTGDNLDALDTVGGSTTLGFELSSYAVRHAPPGPGGTRVAIAVAERLPVASEVADLVVSMDVVEHLDDDTDALREYRRVLRPGGQLLLTVPAYQWLWSRHDVAAGHRRRYRARGLVDAVTAAGLQVERSTYFYSFLVPAAVALRRTPLRRLAADHDEEVGASSPSVTRVMTLLTKLERRLASRHRVPFGLSILVLARRPG
jgi:SAM-dependent methyltransferase